MLNTTSDRPDVRARPRPGTRTGRVWEIADEITREKGRRAERHEVIERYTAENGNRNTAGTQYQYWKRHHHQSRNSAVLTPSERLRDADSQPLKVSSDGRVLIPLEMREAMALGEDGRVTARVEAGELRVVSPAAAVRRIQARMQKLKKPGESVVFDSSALLAIIRARIGAGLDQIDRNEGRSGEPAATAGAILQEVKRRRRDR